MQEVKVKIHGVSPLLMHSDRLANPLDSLSKELKKISSKRKKTDEDHEDMARIEWHGALYFDKDLGPYIPGEVIDATLRESAKITKDGKNIQRGVLTQEDRVKLHYHGPRDLEKMWCNPNFLDQRTVKVGQSRIVRTRPRFDDWSAEFTLLINPEIMDAEEVRIILERAGRVIGMCDYRPRFGKFEVTEYA